MSIQESEHLNDVVEHPRKEMQGRVIGECNFNGSVVEGFHFSLTMHPSHVKVPVMNWVLKVGPTGFVVEGKSLELRRIG